MAGWSAAGGSPGRKGADEDEPPDWLVFGGMIRTVSMGEDEPGLHPLSAALEEEGFDESRSGELVGKLRAPFDGADRRLAGDGFGAVAQELSRSGCRAESGVRRDIDDNGDLLVRRIGKRRGRARRRSLRRWRRRPGSIPKTGGRAA